MPRPPRILKDEGIYHLISRGNNKNPVFEVDNSYKKFKEILFLSRLKFNWRIYHYCLMPNHVHILAWIEKGKELPKLMQHVLQAYSRWYDWKTGFTGYFWQGRYKSPLIENDIYLLECARYIERNPIRASLVRKPEDYLWSSYRYYALGIDDPLIYSNPVYQNFGNNVFERQKKYTDFVKLSSLHEPLLDQALLSKFF